MAMSEHVVTLCLSYIVNGWNLVVMEDQNRK
jgi:hypothetical protein